jgi:tellurite resistance protein
MFIQRHSEREIRPDQVRAMARGLYYLAERDGITESEKDLLRNFLKEGGIDLDLEALARAPFSIEELQHGLDTIFLRKAFLKVCILMARADGTISPEETAALRRLSQALNVEVPLESLMEDLEGRALG